MTRYALVPVVPNCSMCEAFLRLADGEHDSVPQAMQEVVAASPGQGAVTAAQLEAAAEALYLDRFARNGEKPAYRWADERWAKDTWDRLRQDAKAVLMGAGLTVQP